MKTALAGRLNGGPHGLTEIVYAFASATNNNGSAFAGLTVTSQWYQTTLGLCMLIGRLFLAIPVLAIAGSLVRKQKVPVSAGTFPTDTPLFGGLVLGVILWFSRTRRSFDCSVKLISPISSRNSVPP